MKKVISFLILIILIEMVSVNVCVAGTSAEVGKVYSTDIVAYVDGVPINSCNIGGRTGIVCEELKNYGFFVNWEGNTRKLYVAAAGERTDMIGCSEDKRSKEIGKVIGSIYKTDIITYVNGKRIPSYNIGGRTLILIEDLNESYGFTTYWDAEKRTISANPYRSGGTINTDLGTCKIQELASYLDNETSFDVFTCSLKLDEMTVALKNNMIQVNRQEYLPLKETLDSFGVNCTWHSETNTLKIDCMPDKTALRKDLESSHRIDQFKSDDVLIKINMRVEIGNTEYPIMGSVKGDFINRRTSEMPVVYKETVYFPAEALADYFNIIYKGNGSFITKKDDPETWVHDSKYIYMPIDQTDNELYNWIKSTKPENYDSGRNAPIVYPYGKKEPIMIEFARPIDKNSLSKINVPVVREYYSQKDNTFHYEVISDNYNYFYNGEANELILLSSGDSLSKGDYIEIFLRNVIDLKGNKLEGLYRFIFCVD